jgi:Histidine phosphatase superfamily (branch 1)
MNNGTVRASTCLNMVRARFDGGCYAVALGGGAGLSEIYLIRHGHAPFMWGPDMQPSLTQRGIDQARAASERFAQMGPFAIASSPMLRARQTASFLLALWKAPILVHSYLGEIPARRRGCERRPRRGRGIARAELRHRAVGSDHLRCVHDRRRTRQASCDLDWCDRYKRTVFDFDRYRMVEHYEPIARRRGPRSR